MMWRNALQRVSLVLNQWSTPMFFRPVPQLAGMPPMMLQPEQHSAAAEEDSSTSKDDYSIWFAVPKRKHTRSRKRMKTTSQKKLPLKKNIVFDPRTGEVTLMHKLPFNWKEYLPKED